MAKAKRDWGGSPRAQATRISKWTWDAALAAAVLAAIAVVLAVMALPQERIKAMEDFGAELAKAAKGLSKWWQCAAQLWQYASCKWSTSHVTNELLLSIDER
jgi:hypothetical protein